MANPITAHGVLLSIHDTGVLLIGDSGIGKSELALALLRDGHRLIADDIIELRVEKNQVIGHCPALLQDFLEVRGLGVINIRKLFGATAIKPATVIDLVIQLQPLPKAIKPLARIIGQHEQHKLLQYNIPRITLPMAVGRNLAILIETAVQDFQLKQQGYDAQQDFVQRHQQVMREQ